jgi:nucleoid-associated protein YgaU
MGTTPARPTAVRSLLLAVLSAAATLLVAAVLARLTGGSWTRATAPTIADPADVLLALVAGAGTAIAVWLGVSTVAAALASLPGVIGRAATRVAHRIAPAALRRGVAFLVGTAVVAALAPGTAAAAQPAPAGHTVTTTWLTGGPDTPGPDPSFRPLDGTASSTAPATSSPSAAPTAASGPITTSMPTSLPTSKPTGPPTATGSFVGPTLPSRPAAGSSTPTASTPTTEPRGLGPLQRTPASPAGGTGDHVVVRGDSLWDIAAARLGPGASRAQIAREWQRWYAANRVVIGPDPDHIEPGQQLVAPSALPSAPGRAR